MELGGGDVVSSDHCGERTGIVGRGDEVFRVGGLGTVGVDEIGVGVAGGEAVREGVGACEGEEVPSDLWDADGGGEAGDGAGKPSERGDVVAVAGAFFAGLKEHLEADANAEEGEATFEDGSLERFDHVGGVEGFHGGGCGADAGEDDPITVVEVIGVLDETVIDVEALQRVSDARGVSRLVIDNGDGHTVTIVGGLWIAPKIL